MPGVYVEGGAQYKMLAKALKGAANKGLRLELGRALREATKPVINDWRGEALKTLPKGGGFNTYVAKSSFRVKKSSGRNPGVSITCKRSTTHYGGGFIDIDAVNRGRLRHPLYGNRKHWYVEEVTPGWWTRPAERGKQLAQTKAQEAMNNVARKIAASVI